MKKIYIVGEGYSYYANWILKTGIVEETKIFDEADIVLFAGGEDVSPELYDEEKHPRTYSNLKRDVEEIDYFTKAVNKNKKIVGICRGSQFACVLSGGKLIQHVENHGRMHSCTIHYPLKNNVITEDKIFVTSTHHQMQNPYVLNSDEYLLIGYAENLSEVHYGKNNDDNILKTLPKEAFNEKSLFKEPEIVLYRGTNALAIQSHPESMINESNDLKMIQKIFLEFLYDKL